MHVVILLVILFSALGYIIVAARIKDWVNRKRHGHGPMMSPPPAKHDWSKKP
jgi:hypothetical protein